MFYTYIIRSINHPEQRYIGSTADLQARLAIRRFFLLAKISGVQRSGRRMPGNLSSIDIMRDARGLSFFLSESKKRFAS